MVEKPGEMREFLSANEQQPYPRFWMLIILSLQFFMAYFESAFLGADTRNYPTRLSVKGLGYFISCGRKHPDWVSTEKVSVIFDYLLQRGEAVHSE